MQVNLATDFVPADTPLGTGGQAAVFAARAVGVGLATRLGCPPTVAVKLLKATRMTAHQVALLQNEIALMWLLRDQANIVRLYGYSDAPPGILMELFEGDLAGLLQSDARLGVGQLADLAQQWATGLEAMHAQGVAHCDLKTANVFVSRRPGGGWRAAIGDLGTSRSLRSDRASALVHAAPELNVLSARYAAPEVVRAFHRRRPLDAALYFPADIYAAAVMLWECLARAVPWQGCSFEQIAEHLAAGRRPELHLALAPVARASEALAQQLADILPRLWADDALARPPAATLRHSVASLAVMLPGEP
ncbi:serine/threonine protein kinase [Fonticula alba]|uniref:Serine/threonine protein kinase n=1 Tax=Fonticula alba TaxID=691883 RepID=A0A058YZ82_FONAL|nr:serine/threonine protein kinase [Fonticula alba]KCV67310.1 serine/threonine protein kinase [Fonticula alba]|eukprot:XP_009498281.1 serine/threonine protein kinase [Fonticula alba]